MCQFHTSGPEDEPYIAEEGPQIWRGEITIVYQDHHAVDAAVLRLRELQGSVLASTKLATPQGWSANSDQRSTLITCPFGNRFILRAASDEVAGFFSSPSIPTSCCPHAPFFMHALLPFPRKCDDLPSSVHPQPSPAAAIAAATLHLPPLHARDTARPLRHAALTQTASNSHTFAAPAQEARGLGPAYGSRAGPTVEPRWCGAGAGAECGAGAGRVLRPLGIAALSLPCA